MTLNKLSIRANQINTDKISTRSNQFNTTLNTIWPLQWTHTPSLPLTSQLPAMDANTNILTNPPWRSRIKMIAAGTQHSTTRPLADGRIPSTMNMAAAKYPNVMVLTHDDRIFEYSANGWTELPPLPE